VGGRTCPETYRGCLQNNMVMQKAYYLCVWCGVVWAGRGDGWKGRSVRTARLNINNVILGLRTCMLYSPPLTRNYSKLDKYIYSHINTVYSVLDRQAYWLDTCHCPMPTRCRPSASMCGGLILRLVARRFDGAS